MASKQTLHMKNKDQKYFSVEFSEDEQGNTYMLLYDAQGNLVAKSEIPRQDITEAEWTKQLNLL
jgi:hypothetical protein